MSTQNSSIVQERNISQESLDDLLNQTDRIAVYEEPYEEVELLFESQDRDDIESLKTALPIVVPKGKGFLCLCAGSPAISLYANGKKIGQITNHHGDSLRCSLWESTNVMLEDTESYCTWFDQRGIPEVRNEWSAAQERTQKSQDALELWKKAMPACLLSYEGEIFDAFFVNVQAVKNTLLQSYDDRSTAIMALLHWYGSGKGPWSGYPGYEAVAEQLLMGFTTHEILHAIQSTCLSTIQIKGAARFFCGREFLRKRKEELHNLPRTVKELLLAHCLHENDNEKRKRAQEVFT